VSVAVFDVEANGLLEDATRVHCLVVDTRTYHDDPNIKPRHGSLRAGLNYLHSKDLIVAHNGLTYDLPLLHRLYDWRPRAYFFDTQVEARRRFPDIAVDDTGREEFPKHLTGWHSLRAWGHRLGVHKDELETDWHAFNEAMLRYCLQDVLVTKHLYDFLLESH